jgi:hypothetical protein
MSSKSEIHRWTGGIYFTKKWRAEILQPGLEFDNFIPLLKSVIFKWIYSLSSSYFCGGDDQGCLKEGVKTHLIGQICRLCTRHITPSSGSLIITRVRQLWAELVPRWETGLEHCLIRFFSSRQNFVFILSASHERHSKDCFFLFSFFP